MLRISILAALMVAPAHADAWGEYCNALRDAAAGIMTMRQAGIDASTTIGRIEPIQGAEPYVIERMVGDALLTPIWGEKAASDEAVKAFASITHINCTLRAPKP